MSRFLLQICVFVLLGCAAVPALGQEWENPSSLGIAFRNAMVEMDSTFLTPALVTSAYALETERTRFRGELDFPEY